MRLRICCCYCTDEGPTCRAAESTNGTTLPRVVAEQPKLRQSLQLAKIPDDSAVQREEDKEAAQQEVLADKRFADIEAASETQGNTADTQADTASVTASVDKRDDEAVEEVDGGRMSDAVAEVEDEAQQKENAHVTTEQSQSTVSFNVVAPGHFQSVHKGVEFHIVNGEIQSISGACDEADKEFMLAQYAAAMRGVQRAMVGLERGLLGMGRQMNALQPAEPNLHSILAAVHQPPRPPSPPRVTREDFEKFLSHLKAEVRKDDEKVTRDTTDSVDELGGYISEPALERTTFTPKEVLYEDPKTYEKLDANEVPDAKRLDQYIISRDERLATGNAYYFHTARPSRVHRKAPDRKQLLRIASPDRYALFESECVKVHNKYRSMHGVPPLVNNTFLCKVAREWAEHLALTEAFYHRPKNEYGENLYSGDRKYVCARNSVAAWYDEIELYDYKNPKFEKATGHFTQLIWKDTREMGTGVAQIGDKVWVCCNYHPPGNHLNKFNDEYVPRPVVIAKKS